MKANNWNTNNPLEAMEINQNRLLNAIQVAEILNVSRAMAYRLMQTNEIPTVCIRKARRVRPVDLQNYIKGNMASDNSQ